jgi:hypothetical protein
LRDSFQDLVAQAVRPAEPRFISASGVWTFFC